jgi:hypothetical protein
MSSINIRSASGPKSSGTAPIERSSLKRRDAALVWLAAAAAGTGAPKVGSKAGTGVAAAESEADLTSSLAGVFAAERSPSEGAGPDFDFCGVAGAASIVAAAGLGASSDFEMTTNVPSSRTDKTWFGRGLVDEKKEDVQHSGIRK